MTCRTTAGSALRILASSCLVGALAFSALSPARAQDAVLNQARQQLDTGQAAAAFALLAPLETERAGDPRYDYLLGIAAIDAGQPTRAIFALERVLAVQPADNLARAEIARAYLLAGETDTGRAELESARRGPMPAEAAAAIDRVLSSLARPAATQGVRGYAEFSLGHDSNVNSATAASQFAVPAFGGAIFTLAPGSRARDAAFTALGAGLSFNHALGDGRAVVGSVDGRGSFNRAASDFDLAAVDASLGLSQAKGADTFTGAVQLARHWVGGDGFRHAAGLSGQWQRNLSDTQQLAGFGQWSRLSYPDQPTRDADRYVLGVGGASLLGGGGLAYGSVYGVREQPRGSGVAQAGHDGFGLRLGWQHQAGAVTWFARIQAESRRYGGTEPFFNRARHDEQADIALGLHFTPIGQWRITPQISHTRNHSNIVLFGYDRTVVQVTARREF